MKRVIGFGWAFLALSVVACAPQATAAPQTAPYAITGPITVRVDARDAPQMMLHATMRIPARPGPLTLVYPKWIPGNHGPTGNVADIAGLRFSAGGKALAWQRDPVATSEFSLTVPEGAAAVEVALDVVVEKRWAANASVSDINWWRVLLYPKGVRVHDLPIEASAELPAGWHYATVLPRASSGGDVVHFKPVSLETLVDSPVVMARYQRTVDLGTALGAPHSLELLADTQDALAASDRQLAPFRRLVAEGTALFGARHYDSYMFIYILSHGMIGGNGLEHHASSEDVAMSDLFSNDDAYRILREMLPHEYAHSWCGKYRRPKGLATPDYQEPTRNDLLWIYEGLTDYFGWLLATRSGLGSVQDAEDSLASIAASLDVLPGRKWRPLADTTYSPPFSQGSNRDWYSEQRGYDYYAESRLVWLEVDTIIRQKTGGARSLDDFSRAFFGGANSSPEVRPYTLDEVLQALGKVAAYDWKGFFEQRITAVAPRAPLGGIEGAGYRLTYRDQPNALQSAAERAFHSHSERYTLGLSLDEKGTVTDLQLEGPAGRAGVSLGDTLIAVNGRKYSTEVLHQAIADNKGGSAPIELLAEQDGFYRTHRVNWNQGARYPHLERDATKPDLLAAILAPRAR